MRQVSSNVRISNFRFKIKEDLFWVLSDSLARQLKEIVKNEHLEGFKINTRPLPAYSDNYIAWKSMILRKTSSSLIPNLELTGELHDGAKGTSVHKNNQAVAKYSISDEGADHLKQAQNNSGKVWESYDRIGSRIWIEDIMPRIEKEMEKFGNLFGLLESVDPK